MSVIVILILLSLVIATGFLLAFLWAVKSGQFEDTCTPPMRILSKDAPDPGPSSTSTTANNQTFHE
jgi:cbb3-type cytochrome oxidase maturation protein